jgi:hypothetical protein
VNLMTPEEQEQMRTGLGVLLRKVEEMDNHPA